MKKNLLMLLLLLNAVFSISARAQDINVSMQPIWGPEGYNYVNYYYIPAIEAYYSVPNQTFTWYDGTRWVTTMDLPPAYANFDLYHAYKVVLNVANPWYRHNYYRGYYYSYRTRYDQPMIRYSHDRRYYEGRREDRFYHGERRAEFEHRGGEVRVHHRREVTIEIMRRDIDLVRLGRGRNLQGLPHAVPDRIDDRDVDSLLPEIGQEFAKADQRFA